MRGRGDFHAVKNGARPGKVDCVWRLTLPLQVGEGEGIRGIMQVTQLRLFLAREGARMLRWSMSWDECCAFLFRRFGMWESMRNADDGYREFLFERI
jgi:hypothetical protein